MPNGSKPISQREAALLFQKLQITKFAASYIRANKTKGIARLDDLAKFLEYLPMTTPAMRQAAQLWAQARQQGQPTAGDKTIDGDMILVAQAMAVAVPDIVIATTNVGHLSRFVAAGLWQSISPS